MKSFKQIALVTTFLVATSFGAQAALPAAVQSAITSGDMAAVTAAATANPTMQGQIVGALLQAAASMIATNPTGAAAAFSTAAQFASAITAENASATWASIQQVLAATNTSSFQAANGQAAADIYQAALTLTSQQVIIDKVPTAYSDVQTAASQFSNNNPQFAGQFEDDVLLAQEQGGNVTNQGPQEGRASEE